MKWFEIIVTRSCQGSVKFTKYKEYYSIIYFLWQKLMAIE